MCEKQGVTFNNNLLQCRNYGTKSPKRGIFKLGLIGVSFGAIVGTGYSINYLNKPKQHISNEELAIPIIESIPEVMPSKQVLY